MYTSLLKLLPPFCLPALAISLLAHGSLVLIVSTLVTSSSIRKGSETGSLNSSYSVFLADENQNGEITKTTSTSESDHSPKSLLAIKVPLPSRAYLVEAEPETRQPSRSKFDPDSKKNLSVVNEQQSPRQGVSSTVQTRGNPDGVGQNQSGGLEGRGLQAASVIEAPTPRYPMEARRIGFQGQVLLSAQIAIDGSVKACEVLVSSGRRDCDDAAKSTVLKEWRFNPALQNGAPISSIEKILVVFQLEESSL